MKTITVRLPESLVAEIEAESRVRNVSKSDVIRSRLESSRASRDGQTATANLIGSVSGLPPDLSARKKRYLRDLA